MSIAAARIAGVNLPLHKHARIALTHILGVGNTTALKLCAIADINPNEKLGEIGDAELEKLRQAVSALTVEGDLQREIAFNIKRKLDLGCYEGIRHRRKLPLRGQRTKTNARTRKGKKKPVRQ